MHFFVYLLSLLLVAFSADGLGLPQESMCGAKPCNKAAEDSRINKRAVSNTAAATTAVNNTMTATIPTVRTDLPMGGCGWWCRARKRHISETNISDEASAFSPSRQATTDNTPNTTRPVHSPSCGWWCRANKRQINRTKIRVKASTKRQIDLTASEASQSS